MIGASNFLVGATLGNPDIVRPQNYTTNGRATNGRPYENIRTFRHIVVGRGLAPAVPKKSNIVFVRREQAPALQINVQYTSRRGGVSPPVQKRCYITSERVVVGADPYRKNVQNLRGRGWRPRQPVLKQCFFPLERRERVGFPDVTSFPCGRSRTPVPTNQRSI